MNDRENLQLAAFERTLALLNNNLTIIQNIAAITETKNALDNVITQIRLLNIEEEKGMGGAMGSFMDAKNDLINTTLAVQGALIAYAIAENNHALIEAIDFGASYLRKASHQAMYDKCKVVYDLALPFKVALSTGYQLPQTTTEHLGIALETYRLALPNKDLAKQETAAKTKKRKTAFAKASEIMSKLGKLMLMFRSVQPEFFESYQEASYIGGYSSKKAKNQTFVTGQAVDFETHEAIAGAKISVVLQQAETFSGVDGNFSLAIPTPGEITIKAEKAGYNVWEDDIIIELGETVTVLVEIERN